MKKTSIATVLCLASLPLFAQKITELKTDKEKLSYSLGINIAHNLKEQNMENDVDLNIFNQAIKDELSGQDPVLSKDSMNVFMQNYFARKRTEFERIRNEQGEKNKIEGAKFLEQNKNKKGVVTTPSGLQYEILVKSKSTDKPTPEDMVYVKYTGKLLDETVFDSTDKNNNGEPVNFVLNRVIKGWIEGIPLMTKGSRYKFYIPSELAYGENGFGREIPPNAVLIFDVELVDFSKQDPEPTEQK
ncbi:MAG: FKBP-type peptidyl-prolyl cis-trans isomerase [Flavobacteriaceae bacterium]|jgi:FKBP-type peptidyl-prolyl cis-trans isomerase FklB|nr:FKBP-type peptidyl-prolyl cis-trans isomerase [Flavobacteriaceae bacterium]